MNNNPVRHSLLMGLLLVLLVGIPAATSNLLAQSVTCDSITEISQDECAALLAFYQATNGSTWTDLWFNPNAPDSVGYRPCDWPEINCYYGDVTGLIAPDRGITGTLPDQLGNLTSLETLNLSHNALSGPIPTSFGAFSEYRLYEVDLSYNQLSGVIPGEFASICCLYGSNVNLSHNQLSGPVPNFKLVRTLDLSHNQLTSLPTAPFGICSLNLSHNQISGPFPEDFFMNGCLDSEYEGFDISLNLSHNQMSGNLDNFPKYFQVSEIDLSHNQFTGSIPTPPRQSNIFDLSDNQFEGEVRLENENGNSVDIGFIDLSNNQLTGVLAIKGTDATRYLDVSGNQFMAIEPGSLEPLVYLESLNLARNRFTGEFPTGIVKLLRLKTLDVSENAFEGAIPVQLLAMKSLEHVNIRYNMLYSYDPDVAAMLHGFDPNGLATQTIAPRLLKAKPLATNRVRLTWKPIAYTTDPGHYLIQVATLPKGPYTDVGQTADKTASTFDVTGLTANTGYYFRVSSVTNAHNHNANALASRATPYAGTVTLADTSVFQIAPLPNEKLSTTNYEFVWGSDPNALDYVLEIKGKAFAFRLIVPSQDVCDLEVCAVTPNFGSNPPANGAALKWRITARNKPGNYKSRTAWQKFSMAIPGQATLIAPEANAIIDTPNPTFEWEHVPTAQKYQLQVRLRSQIISLVFQQTITAEAAGCLDDNHCELTPGGSEWLLQHAAAYDWRVRSQNDEGKLWSRKQAFTTNLTPTPGLIAPDDNATVETPTPTLTWSYAENAEEYLLSVLRAGSKVVKLRFNTSTTPTLADICNEAAAICSYTLPDPLKVGQKYRWQVRAHNIHGKAKSTKYAFVIGSPAPAVTDFRKP